MIPSPETLPEGLPIRSRAWFESEKEKGLRQRFPKLSYFVIVSAEALIQNLLTFSYSLILVHCSINGVSLSTSQLQLFSDSSVCCFSYFVVIHVAPILNKLLNF